MSRFLTHAWRITSTTGGRRRLCCWSCHGSSSGWRIGRRLGRRDGRRRGAGGRPTAWCTTLRPLWHRHDLVCSHHCQLGSYFHYWRIGQSQRCNTHTTSLSTNSDTIPTLHRQSLVGGSQLTLSSPHCHPSLSTQTWSHPFKTKLPPTVRTAPPTTYRVTIFFLPIANLFFLTHSSQGGKRQTIFPKSNCLCLAKLNRARRKSERASR